ncbi:glyoxylate/hydroxypyruvate reductase A [Salinihabitans flavidus]|uniref:Glyoxylate/hydroxypyruvate reductase A n=1 Tax=Salinihabitans flavidus TaxID=569882 RepID=A0A1H8MR35_9RHOB|nr:glyoxylate/hydroxypyruvate reductase A [Salinihabitans flavidus]SEO19797.1 glyoxylate/hydroxypyruvate reductase A [Salinihabitans flavidus]
MINILFAAPPERWDFYADALHEALDAAAITACLSQDLPPEDVDYIIYAPNGPLRDFTLYTRCKAVLSLWAGVEKIVGNDTLTMPLARMVDDGLSRGMVEWVTGHVLRHHLDIDRDIHRRPGDWTPRIPPLAADRPVTILGLGTLGLECGKALAGLGFPVTGWSRTTKEVPGLTCLHGKDGLGEALKTAQIVILLLPDTPATENTLNAETLSMLPQGAVILNPGRGPLIDDDALLAALDNGHIGHATLDTFRIEPLPEDDPYWHHPKVTVTPHIASETRPGTAARVIAENIRRSEAGEPLLYLVDREAGY